MEDILNKFTHSDEAYNKGLEKQKERDEKHKVFHEKFLESLKFAYATFSEIVLNTCLEAIQNRGNNLKRGVRVDLPTEAIETEFKIFKFDELMYGFRIKNKNYTDRDLRPFTELNLDLPFVSIQKILYNYEKDGKPLHYYLRNESDPERSRKTFIRIYDHEPEPLPKLLWHGQDKLEI